MSLFASSRAVLPDESVVTLGLSQSAEMDKTPIHKIPAETLIDIFKFILLAADRDDTFSVIFRRPYSRVESISTLLTLSRVCKVWKAVICAYPVFWTRADGHHRGLLTRILTRVGKLPLSLFVTSNTEGLLELLASYGSRIQRLDMAIYEGTGEVGNLAFVDGTPLECFTLNYENLSARLQHASPFFLFGEKTLHLKALAISPSGGYLPSNHFPNLTHLYLVLASVRDLPHPITTMSFVDLLSNTPMLECLTVQAIGHSFDLLSNDPIAVDAPVVLPNLRSLVFTLGGMRTVGMVLARLVLPDTALVRLQGIAVPTPEASPLPQLSVTQSINRLHIATERTRLQLVAEGPSSGLWLQARIAKKPVEDDDVDEVEDDPQPDEQDAWNWCGWLSTLPESFPLAQVTKLEIYVGHHHTILSTLLPRMVEVVELTVRLKVDDAPLRDLSPPRLLYMALREADPLLCPNLQVLRIDADGKCPHDSPDLYLEELVQTIIFRSRLGRPISRVVIQPFADADPLRADVYEDSPEQFDALRSVIQELEVRDPGIPVMPCANDAAWERWTVEGIDKYWNVDEYAEVFYAKPWIY